MLINCKGTLLSLDTPIVMAIINATPDSFYTTSRVLQHELLKHAEQHLSDGATILDIGGVSTRPGADEVSEEEELRRVIPAIEAVHRAFPTAIISVDTFRANVAEQAVAVGASIVNDVSGGRFDPTLWRKVADLQTPYIYTHSIGTPKTMQQNPSYNHITAEVFDFFSANLRMLHSMGIHDIILDVGFGFGKTTAHNYQLLRDLAVFKHLDCPVLAGISRKGMIWKPLGIAPEEALNGTTALHIIALQHGAKILRVHDTKPAMECIKLLELLTSDLV